MMATYWNALNNVYYYPNISFDKYPNIGSTITFNFNSIKLTYQYHMLLVNASDELFQLHLRWLANKPDVHVNQTEIIRLDLDKEARSV